MDSLTFEAINVFIKALAAAIAIYVIPVIKRYIDNIVASKWAKDAVQAAEQIKTIKNMTNEEKKEYVAFELAKILQKMKINMTEEQVDILIESAVKELRLNEAKAVEVK